MFSRRKFLTTAAQLGGLAAIGQVSSAADLLTPPAGESTRVVLVKTKNRTTGIIKALKLLDQNPVNGKNVVVKPNLNSDHRFPGSTHNMTLQTLIAQLIDMGAWNITVADRSGMGNTRKVMENKGILALSREMDFKTAMLNELSENQHTHHTSKDWHWNRGFYIPTLFHEADTIVQTCCLKTHQFGGHFTISLKNSVGMVAKTVKKSGYDYMGELHSKGASYQRHMIAEINQAYTPDLIVLDGMEAFIDGGPHMGPRVEPGVIAVGTDRVAVDAVGVAILRMYGGNTTISAGPVFEQTQIKRAVELDLGVQSPEQIVLVTDDADSEAFAAKTRQELARG